MSTSLTWETQDLIDHLDAFLSSPADEEFSQTGNVRNIKIGVYAFFDFDQEPIYVGQTKEGIGTRIRRHLTNQRTDAVAMSVLDPFEVHSIAVYPLSMALIHKDDEAIKATLNRLEWEVYHLQIEKSRFKAILNEKIPESSSVEITIPEPIVGTIAAPRTIELRGHPDFRIARRASTVARLSQIISERKAPVGLRNVLIVQLRRLLYLAETRRQEF